MKSNKKTSDASSVTNADVTVVRTGIDSKPRLGSIRGYRGLAGDAVIRARVDNSNPRQLPSIIEEHQLRQEGRYELGEEEDEYIARLRDIWQSKADDENQRLFIAKLDRLVVEMRNDCSPEYPLEDRTFDEPPPPPSKDQNYSRYPGKSDADPLEWLLEKWGVWLKCQNDQLPRDYLYQHELRHLDPKLMNALRNHIGKGEKLGNYISPRGDLVNDTLTYGARWGKEVELKNAIRARRDRRNRRLRCLPLPDKNMS